MGIGRSVEIEPSMGISAILGITVVVEEEAVLNNPTKSVQLQRLFLAVIRVFVRQLLSKARYKLQLRKTISC